MSKRGFLFGLPLVGSLLHSSLKKALRRLGIEQVLRCPLTLVDRFKCTGEHRFLVLYDRRVQVIDSMFSDLSGQFDTVVQGIVDTISAGPARRKKSLVESLETWINWVLLPYVCSVPKQCYARNVFPRHRCPRDRIQWPRSIAMGDRLDQCPYFCRPFGIFILQQ